MGGRLTLLLARAHGLAARFVAAGTAGRTGDDANLARLIGIYQLMALPAILFFPVAFAAQGLTRIAYVLCSLPILYFILRTMLLTGRPARAVAHLIPTSVLIIVSAVALFTGQGTSHVLAVLPLAPLAAASLLGVRAAVQHGFGALGAVLAVAGSEALTTIQPDALLDGWLLTSTYVAIVFLAVGFGGYARALADRQIDSLQEQGRFIRAQARDLERTRDAAVEASRLKSEFLANMSHEIRTPMNGVLGMTELLLGTPLSDEQCDYATTVRSSAESLLTILNDILDFSKIEAGRLDIEVVDVPLHRVVEEVAALFAEQAAGRGLELLCTVDVGVPDVVRGDPTRIRQVLTNLVGNAVKFTSAGEVVVSASVARSDRARTWVRFEVVDTGIGIPAETRERLFQPFVQADGSTTRRFGGTGLGLAISHQLVTLMNGDMGFQSEPGVGSTFWFELPLSRAAQPPSDELGPIANHRVLVVDDSETNRRILSHHFDTWGLEVVCAPGGPEALELLRGDARGFDVLVLDMLMPNLDGLSVAKAVRASQLGGDPAIVMLSSVHHPIAPEDREEARIAAVLTKPVRTSELRATLASLFRDTPTRPRPPAAERDEDIAGALAGLRVLVVEDNSVNLRIALAQLHKLGCAATTAVNGAEGLAALANDTFDVVLMDCQMPVMDGFAATRVIREQEQRVGGHVPVLAVTANAMEGDAEACLAAGMDGHLSKPYTAQQLARALAQMAAK